MLPLAFRNYTIVSALGRGREATREALQSGRSALRLCAFGDLPFTTYVGEVAGLDLASSEYDLGAFDCRNHRLASIALKEDAFTESVTQARARYGAERIGVFLGTSTSGFLETEVAYRNCHPDSGALPPEFDYTRTHNMYALASFVRTHLALRGPASVVSTACAASAKVFASAARMIAVGLCDAAIVGGVDTLCLITLCGFRSLGVISEEPCRPFDAERRGISIGEAAGFVLLERPELSGSDDGVLLLGVGESTDAYHMSSPDPEGVGARLAMEHALNAARLSPGEIDYINLHGTATVVGDAAEDRAIASLFGSTTPCSSTKGFTGHTLGTSGVLEAIVGALGIAHGFLPGSPHTRTLDPAFGCNYVRETQPAQLNRVLSNSFGFGGANCSLILGRAA